MAKGGSVRVFMGGDDAARIGDSAARPCGGLGRERHDKKLKQPRADFRLAFGFELFAAQGGEALEAGAPGFFVVKAVVCGTDVFERVDAFSFVGGVLEAASREIAAA